MKNDKQFNEPWWRRKAVYVAVAVIGLVLTGFGVVTQDQVDAFNASPLLATLVGLFAASKTHEGSDSRTTDSQVADVADLRQAVDQANQNWSAVKDQLRSDPSRIAQEVLKAIWEAESGRHALGTPGDASVSSETPTEAEGTTREIGSVRDYYRGVEF